MVRLAVDVGNTQIKWAVFEGMQLLHVATIDQESLENELHNLLKIYRIREVLASASGDYKKIATSFASCGLSIAWLQASTPLPFVNKYRSPATLGTDRMALAAAAALNFKRENVLVIDAGTCITYDFKSSRNEYLGGAIAPGLQMRYRSVHEFTARLPLLKPPAAYENMLLGTTTEEALHSGIAGGMVNEILGAMEWYSKKYENLQVVLTGGDAHFLAKSLKNGIFAPSNFLLEGLNYIMDFNTNQ